MQLPYATPVVKLELLLDALRKHIPLMTQVNPLAIALWQPPEQGQQINAFSAWPELARTEVQSSPELALLAAAQEYPGHDVLLIRSHSRLPIGFLERMQTAWRQYPHVDVLSPLDKESGIPLPALPAADIDAMQFLYGPHEVHPVKRWSRHGSFWRCSALKKLLQTHEISTEALTVASLHGVYAEEKCAELKISSHFIGDGKPVVLHVLHSWGGGVEYFARDLRAGDHNRHHLFLKANNIDSLPPYGKKLALYHASTDAALQTWTLAAPIDDTNISSEEVHCILQEIIRRWGVTAVIVSSLVGFSLDVLETGLPTTLACHDVYPFWPLLHDRRDEENADFSQECLQHLLNQPSQASPFSWHSADYWLEIKNKLASIILKRNLVCVAPSEYARKRLCSIDARLHQARWQIIPHGVPALGRMSLDRELANTQRLRVLVPGHVHGDKGETLLSALIPMLPDGIELILLGCATRLEHKFQHASVTCYPEYRREELAVWVDKIKPDIALLPSLVPETFGYVMSEMLLLGLPTICANIGAYAERAQTTNTVFAVAPNATAFIEKLRYFRDRREALRQLTLLPPVTQPSLADMASAWEKACPAMAPNWFFNFPSAPDIQESSAMNQKIDELLVSHAQLYQRLELLQQESLQRAEKLEQSLQQTNELKQTLQQQQKDFRDELVQLQLAQTRQNEMHSVAMMEAQKRNEQSHAALTVKMQEQSVKMQEQSTKMQEQSQIHDRERQAKNAEIQQIDAQLSAAKQELQSVYASHSWQVTAIFRNIKTRFFVKKTR